MDIFNIFFDGWDEAKIQFELIFIIRELVSFGFNSGVFWDNGVRRC